MSVTPADDGALDIVARVAEKLGFTVYRLDFDGTPNLFARRGTGSPHLCFAGHTDVVPAGAAEWSAPPFDAVLREGEGEGEDEIVGRGTSDMKGAIAAFLSAVAGLHGAVDLGEDGSGSISLLITGDEEGPATNGTARVVEWLAERDEVADFTIVGEATNPTRVGEVIKIGRRGSLNVDITVRGVQGHVAYPHRVDNPAHRLVRALASLVDTPLDDGSPDFEPSSLQVTTIDIGNSAENVVPAVATAHVNVRFNDRHTGASLESCIRKTLREHADDVTVAARVSAEPFITPRSGHVSVLAEAIETVTGRVPAYDTGGGTSDARFIAPYAQVAEFGLVSSSIHRADEKVLISDLLILTHVYREVLRRFFRR